MPFEPFRHLPGEFSPNDGTIDFYGRINSLIRPDMTLVDLGAGRAAWFEDDKNAYRKSVRLLKGKVARVIAVDVDEVVMQNRAADECAIMVDGRIPLPDASADMIVSDYVLEHIQDPDSFRAEVDRVLKPGGWLCARTPHKYNLVSLAASAVANRKHSDVLKIAQPDRKEMDVFPTVYRMNTLRDLKSSFPGYRDQSFIFRSDPAYFFGSRIAYKILHVAMRIGPIFHLAIFSSFCRSRSARPDPC